MELFNALFLVIAAAILVKLIGEKLLESIPSNFVTLIHILLVVGAGISAALVNITTVWIAFVFVIIVEMITLQSTKKIKDVFMEDSYIRKQVAKRGYKVLLATLYMFILVQFPDVEAHAEINVVTMIAMLYVIRSTIRGYSQLTKFILLTYERMRRNEVFSVNSLARQLRNQEVTKRYRRKLIGLSKYEKVLYDAEDFEALMSEICVKSDIYSKYSKNITKYGLTVVSPKYANAMNKSLSNMFPNQEIVKEDDIIESISSSFNSNDESRRLLSRIIYEQSEGYQIVDDRYIKDATYQLLMDKVKVYHDKNETIDFEAIVEGYDLHPMMIQREWNSTKE